MELTFNELKKRDVINIADGKCLGNITDLRLSFPQGALVGVYVPGRKVNRLFRCFDKTVIYIDESRIVKIGGDVILVNLRCDDNCSESTTRKNGKNNFCPPKCPPPCPPKCAPQKPRREASNYSSEEVDFSILSGSADRIDRDDY